MKIETFQDSEQYDDKRDVGDVNTHGPSLLGYSCATLVKKCCPMYPVYMRHVKTPPSGFRTRQWRLVDSQSHTVSMLPGLVARLHTGSTTYITKSVIIADKSLHTTNQFMVKAFHTLPNPRSEPPSSKHEGYLLLLLSRRHLKMAILDTGLTCVTRYSQMSLKSDLEGFELCFLWQWR